MAGKLTLKGAEKVPCYSTNDGFSISVEEVEGFSASFYFCPPDKAQKAGISVLRYGILYRLRINLGPGVCGIIVCSSLRRNLSGTGVVEDSKLRAILDRCRQEIEFYLLELIESPYRLRKATLLIRPLLNTLPTNKKLETWKGAVERLQDVAEPRNHRKELQTLLAEERPKEAEDLALAMLAQMVARLDKNYYNREHVFRTAAKQTWLEAITFSQPSLDKAKDLMGICCSLTGKPSVPDNWLTAESHHLICRRNSNPTASLAWIENHANLTHLRVETLMAIGRFTEAESMCFAAFRVTSSEEVNAPSYGDSADLHRLLSYLLEFRGQAVESNRIKSLLLEFDYCDMTRFLRYEEWVQRQRGLLPFPEWLRLRVRASGKAAWLALTFKGHNIPRALDDAMRGAIQGELELPLRELFQADGAVYKHSFSQITHQVCQSLRLHQQYVEADELLATSHLLVRATKLREELSDGNVD